MEKFKYIIIFTLVLLLGLTYYQFYEYKKISRTLISENNKLDDENNKLQALNLENRDLVKNLNETIVKQKDQILSLQGNISSLLGYEPVQEEEDFGSEIYEEYDRMMDEMIPVKENPFDKKFPDLQNETEEKSDFSLEPNVDLNENNEIEGINIKLKKQF
eukprot:Anaeramoba_ignava/a1274_187.p3 GENE.a1274_187~~a1274_187.p3  ORF type:complete len:160 (-),score=18.91 a1274_187:374-853(-)